MLTASGSGTAITLVAGRNFINNEGSNALSTPSGRWLVYSAFPADDTIGSLNSTFTLSSCIYGGSCPSIPSTGNGLLYSDYVQTVTLPSTIQGVINQSSRVATLPAPGASSALIEVDGGTLTPYELGLKPNDPYRWWNRITVKWGE